MDELMSSYVKDAFEIVKAQASVRNMTAEEILSMTKNVAEGLQAVAEGNTNPAVQEPACDPKKAIREQSITCLECGKKFKVLTKKHLMNDHGLTPAEYKEKWGYKKGQALVCKSLAKARREKMANMKLWERRGAKDKAVSE